jgi:hypothetical protein
MWRTIGLVGLALLYVASPASALTAKQKMETCKFGADDQKLTGAERNAFIKKCMGHHNYQPQARKDAIKSEKKKPKAAAAAPKPAATTTAPAATTAPPPPKQ